MLSLSIFADHANLLQPFLFMLQSSSSPLHQSMLHWGLLLTSPAVPLEASLAG